MFLPAFSKKTILALVFVSGINLLYPLATVLNEWPADAAAWDRPTDRIIRLHVIANSDHPIDQNLKYKVRDRIVEAMGPLLSSARDIQESREITRRSLPTIAALAQETVQQEGFDYEVRTEVGRFDFPTRLYGDRYVPAGNYEAVRVVIGTGEGANWWCVLFPPLCFVGTTSGATYISGDGTDSGEVLLPAIAIPQDGLNQTLPKPPVIRWRILEWLFGD